MARKFRGKLHVDALTCDAAGPGQVPGSCVEVFGRQVENRSAEVGPS